MLGRAVLDLAQGLDRPLVVHVDVHAHARIGPGSLLGRVEAPVVLPVPDRLVVGQGAAFQSLVAHRLLVDRCLEGGENRVPVVALVVDWNVPLGDVHVRRYRDDESVGKHEVGDPDVRLLVVEIAHRENAQAVVGILDFETRAVVLAQAPW